MLTQQQYMTLWKVDWHPGGKKPRENGAHVEPETGRIVLNSTVVYLNRATMKQLLTMGAVEGTFINSGTVYCVSPRGYELLREYEVAHPQHRPTS